MALSVATLMALGLSSCGSDDGPGASAKSESPADAIQGYIENMSAGDFEAALGYVIEPGAVTPESVARLSPDIDPTITLISGGEAPEDGSVDTATVEYSWGEEIYSAQVAKGGGDDWRLVEPQHLVDNIDLMADEDTLYSSVLPHLQAVADITVTTPAGDDVTEPPTALFVDPSFLVADEAVLTVDLEGQHGFPSQTVEATLNYENDRVYSEVPVSDSGYDEAPVDLGPLLDEATTLATENMVYRSYYTDTSTGKHVFQDQPVTALDECQMWLRNGFGREVEGFWFACDAALSPTTSTGDKPMENMMTGSSGFPDWFTPPGAKASCEIAEVIDAEYVEETSRVAFVVLDGELRLEWESEPDDGGSSDSRDLSAAEPREVDSAVENWGGGCHPDPLEDATVSSDGMLFVHDLVPSANATPGFVVSTSLSTS